MDWLLNLLKSYASNAVLDEDVDDVTFDTNNLRYKVQKVDPSVFREFESTTYTAHFGNGTDESNGVSIYLPHSIIPPDSFAASHGLRMRFTALKNSKIFVNNDTEQYSVIDADSQFIISAELTKYRVSDLNVPIEYSVPTPKDGRNYTCVYWNTAEKRWSRHGLKDVSSDVNISYCSSNHLTYFAVILDTGYSEPIPEEHHLPLQIISHLGTACSVFGLVATIITYSIFKILRRTSSGKILIHLSTSLLALNITFVIDTVSMVTDSRVGCKVLAMLLQYFVLTTFLWMAMEAVNMYRTLVQVFQKKSATHFVLKGAVIAWGLPIVPIIITATLDIDLYRKLPLNEICMISTSNSYLYYGGYLGPCCVLLLANFIVFSMILRTVCASKKDLHQRSKRVRRTQIGCALSVTFLLGITWVLGFFAIQNTTLVFTYLVCIINPLQGFFIFLFRCALYPEALRSWTIFCTKHTTNVEKQQRSSSQAVGRRNTISSGDKVGNGKKYGNDSEKLINGKGRSTSSSKKNSQSESVVTKGTDMTSVHFFGGLKHENFDNVNSNNSNRRKITDIRFINIKVKDSTS
nr:adhesion G-protein coupled receptor G2-like [Lytechinus pictus]